MCSVLSPWHPKFSKELNRNIFVMDIIIQITDSTDALLTNLFKHALSRYSLWYFKTAKALGFLDLFLAWCKNLFKSEGKKTPTDSTVFYNIIRKYKKLESNSALKAGINRAAEWIDRLLTFYCNTHQSIKILPKSLIPEFACLKVLDKWQLKKMSIRNKLQVICYIDIYKKLYLEPAVC